MAEGGSKVLAGPQYLRAMAAISVLIFHLSNDLWSKSGLERSFVGALTQYAFVGVDVFFCISGFIMVVVSLDGAFKPTLSRVEFFKRRAARILPFLWFSILAYFGFRWLGAHQFDGALLIRSLTLWPGPVAPA